MSVILVPLHATADEPFGVLECCRRIENESQARTLDASKCERFGPLGIVLLALSLERRRLAKLPSLEFVPPKADDASQFLQEVAFVRFLAAPAEAQRELQHGTLQIRRLNALNPLYVEEVADLLFHLVPGTSDEVRDLVQLCLNELLLNVFEHAESQAGAFVLCRWYAQDKNVRIAVADGGIGIPAALRRRAVQDLRSKGDKEAIIAAVTQRGLTSREVGRPGGLGLKHIHGIAAERGGRLTVISHSARVLFRRTQHASRKTPHFRGTAIEIDFRPEATATRRVKEVL